MKKCQAFFFFSGERSSPASELSLDFRAQVPGPVAYKSISGGKLRWLLIDMSLETSSSAVS